MEIIRFEIGDTLHFKVRAAAYAVPRGTIKRKITGIQEGCPTVAFMGYRDFVVYLREIIAVTQKN